MPSHQGGGCGHMGVVDGSGQGCGHVEVTFARPLSVGSCASDI